MDDIAIAVATLLGKEAATRAAGKVGESLLPAVTGAIRAIRDRLRRAGDHDVDEALDLVEGGGDEAISALATAVERVISEDDSLRSDLQEELTKVQSSAPSITFGDGAVVNKVQVFGTVHTETFHA